MALRDEDAQHHSPSFLDALLCEEQDTFEEDLDDANGSEVETNTHDPSARKLQSLPLVLLDNDVFWEDDELVSLISKEGEETHCLLRDKPWMTQLTAVACLSLAAKVEETHVPLLLDLQVEESRFVFEAKTIQRMELLVLSTLKWKMHPVTPISFFEHIVRRLGLKSRLHWEFLWRCERVLLNVIADSRVMSYLPSTLAAATMIHVIKEIEPFNATEYIDQLLSLLKISEEQLNKCYKLILKLVVCHEGIYNLNQKRKRLSEPSSPGGVIDASFSCDSSNDSWTMASPFSLPPEPLLKRRRAQDQQMRLPLVNRVSIDVLNSPC
ncbi:Cyclin-like [Sesbania bispinosa]|nr:Cyclin-like [Sesbania bispinosa]